MRQLGEYILSQGMTITKAFSVFDTDGNGTVDMSELQQALTNGRPPTPALSSLPLTTT